MSVSKGFDARVIINASIYREHKGDGSDTIPISISLNQYPITKTQNTSDPADNSSYIQVYINESTVATSNVSYSINASLGTISLNISSASKAVEISYPTYRVVGYAKGITMDHKVDLEKIYVVGTKDAKEISQGHTDITGSIEEFLVDRRAWGMSEESKIKGDIEDFTFRIKPNTDESKEFFLRETKIGSFGLDFTADGVTGHSLDFTATNVSTA